MDEAKEESLEKETPNTDGEEMELDTKEDGETKDDDTDGSSATDLPSSEKRVRHAITGRGVTLKMLMMDGVIHPGESLISLDYLGQKFTADLLSSGKIKSNEFDQTFPSPSSWAIYCKKLVNPAKPSGCGWSAVKYKGRKLDSWKAIWLRQLNPQSPETQDTQVNPSALTTDSILETDQSCTVQSACPSVAPDVSAAGHLSGTFLPNKAVFDDNCILDLTKKPTTQETKVPKVPETTERKSESDLMFLGVQEEALNLSMKATPTPKPVQKTPPVSVKQEIKTESVEPARCGTGAMKHASLPCRNVHIDQNQLVDCETFSNLGKAQPYTVSMSTNSLLLLDFHSHLTTSEVVGYLGGKWDQSAQHLSIQQAFPCRCRLGDSHTAADVEDEIRASMKHLGMSLVGWYHSHPYSPAEPSVKDIECQMMYQLKMKGVKSTYYPCVGIINSPYDGKSLKTESSIRMYMVMPPPETVQTDYGVPMSLKYSTKQNHSISEDLLHEMRLLCEFYNSAPDWISFKHSWHPSITYLEKLKTSLHDKLPSDQMNNGSFLDFVQHVLSLNS